MPFFLGLEAGFMDFLGPKGFKSHFLELVLKLGFFAYLGSRRTNDKSTSLLLRVLELGLSAALPSFY